MNIIKNLGLLIFSIITVSVNAQTDKAVTAQIVEEKNYAFVANSALPLNTTDINAVMSRMPGNVNAGVINLSGSNYDIKVTPDSIVAYLPFYGRAFRATFNTDESGFKFTSRDFTYTNKKRKKGGWDIAIKTNDVKDNVRMSLNITESGYATLNVSSNDKQAISYSGYLSELKKPL